MREADRQTDGQREQARGEQKKQERQVRELAFLRGLLVA